MSTRNRDGGIFLQEREERIPSNQLPTKLDIIKAYNLGGGVGLKGNVYIVTQR